jgi:hypothetical protein
MGRFSNFFKKRGKKEDASISPQDDLSNEKEEEMLNWLAEKIIEYKMQMPATFFLETYRPVSTIMSDLFLLSGFPLMLEVFNVHSYEWTALFRKKENIKRLLEKIE